MKYLHFEIIYIPDTFAHISNEILTIRISWNTFTHISNEILTCLGSLYGSMRDPYTFAHISNEILTFWISWNTFTHISNEILTFWNHLCPGHICTYFK